MEVVKLEEAGFDSAMYGFSLSYRKPGITREEHWTDARKEQTYKAALANASRDKGHNKFLEHIQVWFSITATLEWWKQFDTYRIGVSKQSASTMHTLDSVSIELSHFDIEEEEFNSADAYHVYLEYLMMLDSQKPRLKSKALPQGYLQEREVNLNYKVIRHIALQRFAHRIADWQKLLKDIFDQIEHPEFIAQLDYGMLPEEKK